MADSGQTIRELLSGFNNMQASLGLLPTSGQAQGFQGGMTPPPQIKHPGETSVEMVSRASQQASYTMQAAMMPRQMPAPGVLGLTAGNAPVAPPPPQGGVGGQFSREFGARMQSIQSQYMSPYQAQFYAGASGQEGFQNLPSPVFMTPPSMGVFRPAAPPPPPIQIARDRPFITTPFTPRMPAPMFQTPREMRYQQGVQYDEDMWSFGMGAVPTAGRLGMGALGMLGGASFGMGAAAAAFGPRAAGLGRVGGMIGGAALGFGALGSLAERGVEGLMQPIVQTRAFGRQLETLTQPNVVGGADVNPYTGRGLTARAGIGLANQMQGMVGRGETSGFNMRDMMRITGTAADTGMLDMAQSGEQIANTVRNIARGVSSFMRIAQEPDLRRAMQQMSSMRTMGLTIPETTLAMQNAQTFARMSGTSVPGIMQAGMPGAMTFQQQGMTAGLGMQVGMGALGMARQAVAGGAFTPGQLAMAGGTSGIQQTLTEGTAAGLGVNFPIAAMLSRNAQGNLAIDPSRVRQLMSGKMTMTQQAAMASENIARLGDPSKTIQEMGTRMSELRDELGKSMSPDELLDYTAQQIQNLRKEVPGLTFGAGARMYGMNEQQARTFEIQYGDQGFWRNRRRQSRMSIDRARDEERDRLDVEQETSTLTGQLGRRVGKPLGAFGRAIGETLGDVRGTAARWWTDREEDTRATEQGAAFVRRPDALAVESRRSQKAIDEFVTGGGFGRFTEQYGAELGRGVGARGVSGREVAGSLWNTALAGVGIAGSAVTGGLAGAAIGLGMPMIGSRAPGGSDVVGAARTLGGFGGNFAAAFSPITNLLAALPIDALQKQFQVRVEEARDVSKAAGQMREGESMSAAAVKEVRKSQQEVYRQYAKKGGKPTESGMDAGAETAIVDSLIASFKDKSSFWGDKAMSTSEMKKSAIEAMVGRGESRDVATKFVNDQWDKGMGQVILRRVKREAGPEAAGAIAKTEAGQGYEGFLAGKDLKTVLANVEEFEQGTKKMMGVYGFGQYTTAMTASKEGVKEFTEMMLGTSDTDEVMLMQAQALKQSEDSYQRDKGAALERQLEGRLGTEKVGELRERVSNRLTGYSDAGKEMLRRSGVQVADAQDPKAALDEIQKRLKGSRAVEQMATGATRMREGGVRAMEGMAAGGFSESATKATIDRIISDKSQRKNLSSTAAAAVDRYEKATDEQGKTAAIREFQAAVQQAGSGEGRTMTVGGRGVGGSAEEREKKAQGRRDDLEKAIARQGMGFGDTDATLAKAIPVFADGAIALQETAYKVSDFIDKMSLTARLPSTPGGR